MIFGVLNDSLVDSVQMMDKIDLRRIDIVQWLILIKMEVFRVDCDRGLRGILIVNGLRRYEHQIEKDCHN